LGEFPSTFGAFFCTGISTNQCRNRVDGLTADWRSPNLISQLALTNQKSIPSGRSHVIIEGDIAGAPSILTE
jgi:hypothetical protein